MLTWMSKPAVAIDTETCPIIPGLLAPPLAVVSYHHHKGRGLLAWNACFVELLGLFDGAARGQQVVVGANVAYDAAVLCALYPDLVPLVFAAYDAGCILDIQIMEQLRDIANGQLERPGETRNGSRYSLKALTAKYTQRPEMDKDTWRMGYGLLRDTPLADWPQGARDYALDDATATLEVYKAQLADPDADMYFVDAPAQSRNSFSLHLMCTWGMRTDGPHVAALESTLAKQLADAEAALVKSGLARTNKDGTISRNMAAIKARVEADFRAQGLVAPTTPSGAVATGGDVIDLTNDEALAPLRAYNQASKLLSTYVPVLKEGVDKPINARFRMVESGRTGANKNMQTLPRHPGVRESYVPRACHLYVSNDYDSVEMRTLAQVCYSLFGHSALRDFYVADPLGDPHAALAGRFMGITYAEALAIKKDKSHPRYAEFKKSRQNAKAANFGLPGGMGVARFCATYRKDIPGLDEAMGREIKEGWMRQWPEVAEFFRFVTRETDRFGRIEQLFSGRIRGGVSFCDGANTLFQGLAADGANYARWCLQLKMYADPSSVLYGSRVVNFLHDEVLVEVPEARAAECADAIKEIMERAMECYTPDVPIRTSPALMRCWSKAADSVFTADGRLAVWEPGKAA